MLPIVSHQFLPRHQHLLYNLAQLLKRRLTLAAILLCQHLYRFINFDLPATSRHHCRIASRRRRGRRRGTTLFCASVGPMFRYFQNERFQRRFIGYQLFVHPVGFLQQRVDIGDGLFTIVVVFYRLDGTTGFGQQREIEFGVFAEAARVTQERIFFVVVDGAAFVALEHVLAAIGAHAGIRRYCRAASVTITGCCKHYAEFCITDQ